MLLDARKDRVNDVGMRYALLVLVFLVGCGAPRSEPWVVSRLYFGLSSDAGPVTDEQFRDFLEQEVTVQFPAGLTRYQTEGQWRGADGVVRREPSAVIELVHLDSVASTAKLQAIIYLYKKRFHQESVLLIQGHPQVRFE